MKIYKFEINKFFTIRLQRWSDSTFFVCDKNLNYFKNKYNLGITKSFIIKRNNICMPIVFCLPLYESSLMNSGHESLIRGLTVLINNQQSLVMIN